MRVFDGAGREWAGRVVSTGKRGVTIDLGEPVPPPPEPPVRVTLGMALLRGDQMDAVVRDATVLGVAAIVPFVSAHVAVPGRAWKGETGRARWQRVAVAAAKQSRRAVVPALSAVTSFDAVIREAGDATVVMCVEPSRATKTLEPVESRPPSAALLLVGPEGGWTEAEIDHVQARGAYRLALGPRTLRAELAPVVALSALWTRWGW